MAEFYIEYPTIMNERKREVINSVNVSKAIDKLIKSNKYLNDESEINCQKILKKIYRLTLTGKNKIHNLINFETKVVLGKNESISKEEMKSLIDADQIITYNYVLIGYKLASMLWDKEGYSYYIN